VRLRVALIIAALSLMACGDTTPATPTRTVGGTANGVPVRSFCDPQRPVRIYYIEYDDSGGNHIAISVIADPSCAK
jgi:hypothetical protein